MNVLILVVLEGSLLLQLMQPFIENHINAIDYYLVGNKIIVAVTLCLFTVAQKNTFLGLWISLGPIGIRNMHKTFTAKDSEMCR